MEEKLRLLKAVEEEIKKCEECKKNKFGLPVPGKGNPNAKIIFLGESPGPQESKKGEPFIGPSGKFLDKLLDFIGIKREDVFITSPVKYYPGSRAPTNEEIMHGMTHTSKQIKIINPKLIVMLGNVALKALFPNQRLKVSEIHGKPIEKDGRIYFPTFHPSAARRFPKIREKMIEDFEKLKKIIKNLS
jgi:DNA polymerase